MMLPTSLCIMPTEDLEEDEEIDSLYTSGWDAAPGIGAKLLVVPIKQGQQLRLIKCLYTVTAVIETGTKDWPWELKVDIKHVATPRRWYDIVEEVSYQGLVPIVGARDQGDRISHQPTIQLIFELLGEA
jgi:hypothetical protein